MNIQAAFALWLLATLAVVALANTPTRSRIAVLFSVSLIPLPAFVAAFPVPMALLAFAIVILFAVSLDFASGRRPDDLGGRLTYAFAYLFLADAYQAVPCQRWFDKRAVVQIVGSVPGLSALSWAAFFAAQPPLLLAERQLQVRKWPATFARAWTIATLVVLLPLLVNPVLPLFHTAL